MEGRKDDAGKVPYELLAPEMLDGVAQVLRFGAEKYEPRNWEKGMAWGRVFGATMRHLWAWWRGEAEDPETGMSHLWHAGCCIMFLIAYEARRTGKDDRPNTPSFMQTWLDHNLPPHTPGPLDPGSNHDPFPFWKSKTQPWPCQHDWVLVTDSSGPHYQCSLCGKREGWGEVGLRG